MDGKMTMEEVAGELGTSVYKVELLVRRRLLQVTREADGTMMITRSAFNQYKMRKARTSRQYRELQAMSPGAAIVMKSTDRWLR